MTTFQIGDRVRIVKSYFSEDPSRAAGGTGTVVKTYDNDYGVDLRVDNDPGDYGEDMEWTFPVDFLEKIEEPEQVTFEVGDLVSIGKDETHHGFAPGTVARVLKVFGTSTYKCLLVTTRPAVDEYPEWEEGVTAYVNHEPDEGGAEDDVRLVAKAGTEGAVLSSQSVTYEEFREIVLVDGLKAAYDRLNITHK